MKSIFNSFYNSINQFNYMKGGSYPTDPDSLEFAQVMKNQILRVQEELDELLEAIEYNQKEEIIDGICDVLYTALPIAEIAFSAGYKVEPACMEVAKNNLEKYPTSYEIAVKSAEKLGESYCHIDSRDYNGVTYYSILRNEDMKLMKPIGYESVNLKKFVPEEK
ncbi:Phosphoribosyl-ATP pyrophosphohydrolase [compost metagenome]